MANKKDNPQGKKETIFEYENRLKKEAKEALKKIKENEKLKK